MHKRYLFFGLLIISIMTFFVLASPLITIISPTTDQTCYHNGNSSCLLINSYILDEPSLTNITYSFNNTNISIYDSSLLLYYNFNNYSTLGENQTFIRDISTYANNATGYNFTFVSSNDINGAYFSGINMSISGQITAPSVLRNNTDFTISVWVQPYNYSNDDSGTILYFLTWSKMYFRKDTQNCRWYLYNGSAGTEITTPCYPGNWYNLVGVRQGNMSLFYVNGNFVGNKSFIPRNKDQLFAESNIWIGGRTGYPNLGDIEFNGTIDDLMIWNRSLSASEIKQWYSLFINKYNSSRYAIASGNYIYEKNNYNFGLCSTNTSNSKSCNFSSINYNIISNISVDFSNSLGIVRNNFYGVNFHGDWFNDNTSIDVNNDGTIQGTSNQTWHRQLFTQSNMDYLRDDMNLGSYYDGPYNLGFEDWMNTIPTFYNATLLIDNYVMGWYVNSINWTANGTLSRSTDAHSGLYSMNITANSNYLYTIQPVSLIDNHTYNLSGWFKGYGNVSLILQKNGGTYSGCSKNIVLNWSWQFASITCNITNPSGLTLNEFSETVDGQRISIDGIHANESVLIDDIRLTENNNDVLYWRIGNASRRRHNVEWANQNGYKILEIADYMPRFLSNLTSGCNYTSGSSYDRCGPTNYTLFAKLVTDYINRTTSGTYNSTIDVEVWNEPYGSFLLDNLTYDNVSKFYEYSRIYNATRTAIKAIYPNMAVGGPSGFRMGPLGTGTSTMINGFLSNYSNQMDFVSLHPYTDMSTKNNGYLNNWMKQRMDELVGNCSVYNANCSRIILSEWNNYDATILNNYSRSKELGVHIALAYSDLLNYYPSNISNTFYEWSEPYFENYSGYPDGGDLLAMVSEPQLSNVIRSPYNTTKSFATYHSSGSTVVNSTSADKSLATVSSYKNGQYYLTVISKDPTDKTNALLTIQNLNGYSNARDLQTGQTYPISNNIVDLGQISPYDIKYLTFDLGTTPAVDQTGYNSNTQQNNDSIIQQGSSNTNIPQPVLDTIHSNEICKDIKSFLSAKAVKGLSFSQIKIQEIDNFISAEAEKYKIPNNLIHNYVYSYKLKCGEDYPQPAWLWLRNNYVALIIVLIIIVIIIKGLRGE